MITSLKTTVFITIIISVLLYMVLKKYHSKNFESFKVNGMIKIPADLQVDGKLFVNNDPLNRKDVKLMMYPIGSIFITTVKDNPSSVIGGTWEEFGQGRTLIGHGPVTDSSNNRRTFEAGRTGGEISHKLTIGEMPAHTHTLADRVRGAPGALWAGSGPYLLNDLTRSIKTETTPNTTDSTGGSDAHNIMQPYIVTYMWKRIA